MSPNESSSPPPFDALGLTSGTVRVVPYDARWRELYAAEAARLTASLESQGLHLPLEHTGSTSVPGLAAKPIVDILGGRSPNTSRDQLIAAIESCGYSYRGEQGIAGRDFFRRGDPRSYHLHVTELGSAFWQEHVLFRDYLRSHPDVAVEYQQLKLDLAARFPTDREAYIAGKAAFVAGVLARAVTER